MRVIENMGTVNIRTRGLKIAEIIIIDADEQRRWVYEQSLYNVFRHFLDFAAIINPNTDTGIKIYIPKQTPNHKRSMIISESSL